MKSYSAEIIAALRSYSTGKISRADAIAAVPCRDYAELLVALGDAGFPPRALTAQPADESEAAFEAIWNAPEKC